MRRRRRHRSWRWARSVGLGVLVAVLTLEIVYRLVALPPDYRPERQEAALPANETVLAPETAPEIVPEAAEAAPAAPSVAAKDESAVALVPPDALPGLRIERRIERPAPRQRAVLPGPVAESGPALALHPPPPLPPEPGLPPPAVPPGEVAGSTAPGPPRDAAPPSDVTGPPVATLVPPPAPRRPLPPPPGDGTAPLIVIVIDDMGYSPEAFRRLTAMPGPLTLAFLPYAGGTAGMLAPAEARGLELLLHLPMEPLGDANPGPEALLVDLDEAELRRRVRWAIGQVPGIVGVNNHMGSRFTSDLRGLAIVMEELRAHRLFFLDSRTNSSSFAERVALAAGIPATGRDIFIDHDPTPAFIAHQLAAVERTARANGDVIAIGHPYPATLAALETWLPTLAGRGFRLARLSEVMARRLCARAVSGAEPCGPALHLIGYDMGGQAPEPAAGLAPAPAEATP